MEIKWFGHSHFLITLENGFKIAIDPFDNTVGYKIPGISADLVLVSHDHFDHNAVSNIKGDFKVLKDIKEYEANGVKIKGFLTYHDKEKGAQRGKNIAFKITTEDLNVLHMGDLGEIPSEATLDSIKPVDILLIPVGGYYTIDAKEAKIIKEALNPSITIPMHYKTPEIDFSIKGVEDFIKNETPINIGLPYIRLLKNTLPEKPSIMLLTYK